MMFELLLLLLLQLLVSVVEVVMVLLGMLVKDATTVGYCEIIGKRCYNYFYN